MPNNIYIEGPNGIGKTTFAKYLCETYGFKYKHHTLPKIFSKTFMKFDYWFKERFYKNTVFDRCWYSEYVCGQVYRGKTCLQLKDLVQLTRMTEKKSRIMMFMPSYEIVDKIIDVIETRSKKENHPYNPIKKEYHDILTFYTIAINYTDTPFVVVDDYIANVVKRGEK